MLPSSIILASRVTATLVILAALAVRPGAAQERHELRGQVVDAITGAPVAVAVHVLVIGQLGYAAATSQVAVPQRERLVIRISPEPIALEAIRVYNDRLHRDALRRGAFFRVFDRDDILATGAADGLAFLRLGPRMPIVLCDEQDEHERLCTRRPLEGATGAPLMGGVHRAGTFPYARSKVLDVLRIGSRYNAIAAIKGLAYPPVYLDDHLLPGGLAALESVPMSTLHRVETFGARGELEVRLYTAAYLEELATGAGRPLFAVPSADVYEPPATVVRPDTVGG